MNGQLIIDVFNGDSFTAMELTSFVDRHPFLPTGIGELDIFDPVPLRTTALAVEERDGILTLIPTSPRGAPATERQTEKRKMRYFETPRLFHGDTLYVSELQNVRDFVGDNGVAVTTLMQVQSEVARRLVGATGLTKNLEYTLEYHRLGAIQGILLDANGSVLHNWFDEFEITPASPIAFDLAAGVSSATGTIRPICNNIVRTMMRASKGVWQRGSRVVALCGDEFYDGFTNHVDVRQTFLNWNAAKELRAGQAFSQFTFGDITWINYRGSDDNSTVAIPTGDARFIPVGCQGVFQKAMGPGESAEFVNQPGRPQYILPIIDEKRRMWFRSELYSYPLHICTRPDMLASGTA
jgi:hypothetical protein